MQLKILLVDDEQPVRESLSELLEEHGYFIYAKSNGKDGLAFFEAHQDEIDVAVIDKNMPGLDGEQLLSALKKIRPHLPIILATGSVENECIAALEQKGASCLLIKPFEPTELLSAISSALQVKA